MQWRHPLSLSLSTPQSQVPPSPPPTTQINTNSSIPFRELLLQQQQLQQQQQQHHQQQLQQQQQQQQQHLQNMHRKSPQQIHSSPPPPPPALLTQSLQQQPLHHLHHQKTSQLPNEAKRKLVPASLSSPNINASEVDRSALASHFHERDRLILQHQQQQLQQQMMQQQQQHHKQSHKQGEAHPGDELQSNRHIKRETCLINNNDRLQDYDASEREREISVRLKSPGKFKIVLFIVD